MSDESSLDVTPEHALEEALARVRDPAKRPPDKALVLLLWDDHGGYDTGFHNAGMSASQMIALCEVHKSHCLEMMKREDRPHSEDA